MRRWFLNVKATVPCWKQNVIRFFFFNAQNLFSGFSRAHPTLDQENPPKMYTSQAAFSTIFRIIGSL